ncbi:hypothetical protein Q7C30_007470 [Pseudomonas sp. RAC1]|uniref:DUF7079 family protein n=1 Tax=Pseudomonas sp. RAC1 TaxID=3064900 RepID=UPI0027270CF8|nr:hypothetical protein [Pseudomonas sp. RAC1]MDV9031932.1 hypothetical protein [Pseudomonas sp. RAC1]
MSTVDADRLRVWQALSEFFLDTDVDLSSDGLVQRLAQTGYTPDQVQCILWNEVYPVLHSNLQSMAGEWAGWTDAFLQAHLVVRPYSPGMPARGWIGAEISRCWDEVLTRWARLKTS